MIESPEFRFVESTHQYFLGDVQLPSVTFILDKLGLISSFCKDEEAAFRGQLAHKACQYLLEGRLDWSTVDPEIMGYVVSLDRWREGSGIKVKRCEHSAYHKELLYAGTVDLECELPNYRGELIVDFKTGVPATWHRWQTSAYSGIFGRSKLRGGLYLQKDGSTAKFKLHDGSTDWGKFVAALTVLRMKEE